MYINRQGFIRVAAASPRLRVADCDYNRREIQSMIGEAVEQQVQVVCFPELSLTGYSCGDLFFQETLQREAIASLQELAHFMHDKRSLTAIVGLPLRIGSNLFNMAAVIAAEGIVGLVPKTHVPNDREYYEKRWFAAASSLTVHSFEIGGREVPVAAGGMLLSLIHI